MKELLKKLTNAFGPSGYESQVRDLILETIKDDVDEYRIDALGNLIARKGTRKENGKRIPKKNAKGHNIQNFAAGSRNPCFLGRREGKGRLRRPGGGEEGRKAKIISKNRQETAGFIPNIPCVRKKERAWCPWHTEKSEGYGAERPGSSGFREGKNPEMKGAHLFL